LSAGVYKAYVLGGNVPDTIHRNYIIEYIFLVPINATGFLVAVHWFRPLNFPIARPYFLVESTVAAKRGEYSNVQTDRKGLIRNIRGRYVPQICHNSVNTSIIF